MSSLITRSTLKRYLLERSKSLRPYHPFTRVSEEALVHLENQLRLMADSFIKTHPAKGTTLKP
jgi:hypothetical protein